MSKRTRSQRPNASPLPVAKKRAYLSKQNPLTTFLPTVKKQLGDSGISSVSVITPERLSVSQQCVRCAQGFTAKEYFKFCPKC